VEQRVLDQPIALVSETPNRIAIGPRTDAAARRGAQLVVRVDAPRRSPRGARPPPVGRGLSRSDSMSKSAFTLIPPT
jgi:hypothetical protein